MSRAAHRRQGAGLARRRGGGRSGGGGAPSLPRANLIADYNSYSPSFYTLDGASRASLLINQASPGTNDAAQGAAASRMAIAIAGAPDGLHDAFDLTNFAGNGVGAERTFAGLAIPLSAYAVAQMPADGRYIFGSGAPGGSPSMARSVNDLYITQGTATLRDTASPAVGTWGVMQGVYNGVSSKIAVTGGATFSGDASGAIVTTIVLGNLFTYGAAFCLDAKCTRWLFYSAAHTDVQRAAVLAYLRAWSGL